MNTKTSQWLGFFIGVVATNVLLIWTCKSELNTPARKLSNDVRITAAPPELALIYKHTPTEDYFDRPFGLAAYNGMARCPLWVLEDLTKKHLAGKARRTGLNFFADPDIPIEFRAHPSAYAAQDEDLGHGASAANHEHDADEMKSTFTMLNCMPETPACNRIIVLQGENLAREFAQADDDVHVLRLTAPCWLPDTESFKGGKRRAHLKFDAIGKDNVWIPTHIAFSVLIIEPKKPLQMRGWLVPNLQQYPEAATFDTYKSSVDEIEGKVGLNLWKGLDIGVQSALEKEVHK